MNIDIFSFIQTIYVYIKFKGKVKRFTFANSSLTMYQIEKTLRNFGVLVYGRKLHSNGDKSFFGKIKPSKVGGAAMF